MISRPPPAGWSVLAALGVAVGVGAGGGGLGQAVVIAGLVCAVAGVVSARYRQIATCVAASLLVGAAAGLAVALVGDRFDLAYVWLYSSADLPWVYKLANLWGGDEGTLLLLSALAAGGALVLAKRPLVGAADWAVPGALVIGAWFALGAAIWSPFAATPADLDAAAGGQGMNAHLIRVWMLLHPPFVFGAYALFLVPAGSALQALARGDGRWGAIAARCTRLGWLTLSAGLASGMWWAYEDFTFGQFWHWDPVQTSVFMVWALATAHLHMLRRYREDGAYARLHPLLGLLTGIGALLSLVVTRAPQLASSHRYVGASSYVWLLAGAGLLVVATLAAVWASRARRPVRARNNEMAILIQIAVACLIGSALVAGTFVAHAYVATALGWSRPESLKPFFEFLARWSSSVEAEALRAMFDQWEPDRYGLNRWLAPIGIVIGLAGGHNFLPVRRRVARVAITAGVAMLAAASAFWLNPLARLYTGEGMTSSHTTAIFPWLDGLAVAMAYFGVAALAWALAAWARRGNCRPVRTYFMPVGVLHLGMVVALVAASTASIYDLSTKRDLRFPEDFGKPISFPWGYEISVSIEREGRVRDGGRGAGEVGAFEAVGEISWRRLFDGEMVQRADGAARYRDLAPPAPAGLGPVRLMCEILDYRYARTLSSDSQIIDPFIHRGLWRDVQVWLPAIEYQRVDGAEDEDLSALRLPTTVPLVLKVYPMMTWMWVGLGTVLVGAGVILGRTFGRESRA